ncbi:MAG: MBL fold metallo-hydrolase [Phycicoccus sp.]|nr:MBL fold metallo-hydrolase [Phycicoccus sp.]
MSGLARTARLDVLFTGYAADRVAGTVSLIRDGDRVIVVDPGMVPARAAILDPLEQLGVSPGDVTDVVLSHHHPDHTVNIALFGEIPVHDFQAVYHRDSWDARAADGVHLTPSVRLLGVLTTKVRYAVGW